MELHDYSTKTQYLKEKCERDEKQHLAEMKELSRIIEHEKQLKKFMSDKTAERHDDSQMVAWRQEKVSKAEHKKLSEKDSPATLEEASMKIIQLMETDNVEQIIKKFDEKEESNFVLFKFVNEQNSNLDKLANEIEEKNTEISKKEFNNLEQKRQNELTAMESQLSRFKNVNDTYKQEIEKIGNSTEIFINEIESLFGCMDCNKYMPPNSFGELDKITKKNVVKYMQAIEKRLNQLIIISNAIQVKEIGHSKRNIPISAKKSIRSQQSPPQLPNIDIQGDG
ncbi:uncharacterized protein LOC115228655 [Octopus sinensis]|uniref:Uncharacterized protein LOC115228655 n=1 Tax=Octopus sinensis TaxID=2607531 RepID=A0A7E6EHY7_9MOLL|nr:uncharacterized protein LOC115228655 [Octopus sinensis]